ncbi:MAG: zinc-binding dehydrogenase [Candidatus Hodarchaeota archaeon]
MKGLYFTRVNKVEVRDDLPIPQIQVDEVLIRVKNCGICGSDIGSFLTGALESQQMILGHEFSGEIVEIGKKIKNLNVGDRVTANPNVPCLECRYCREGQEVLCIHNTIGVTHNGALAEFVKIRADRVHKLPDSISFEEGAMIEPLANAIQAVKISDFKIGNNATVFGTGTIGLLTIQALKIAGAHNIYAIEPVESKHKLALELGADKVFTPRQWSRIIKLTEKIGPDFIYDCVALPGTIITSLQLIKRGGSIIVIGIHSEPFEMKGILQLMTKNITIRGMFLVDQDSFKTALRLLEQRRVNVKSIITKRIKLDQVPEAFHKLSSGLHDDIKIQLEID